MSTKVIVIDGNISSGKTTYIKLIKEALISKELKVCVVKEPVAHWQEIGILEKFYKNPKKYAYAFQTYVFVTRIKEACRKYEKHGNNVDVYILERSWYTDPIFAKINHKSRNINDIEYKMYLEWCNFHKQTVPFTPTGFVYLDCPAEVSYERCHIRNRNGECDIGIEYLRDLKAEHDIFVNELNKPVMKYNAAVNFKDDTVMQTQAVSLFMDFIK